MEPDMGSTAVSTLGPSQWRASVSLYNSGKVGPDVTVIATSSPGLGESQGRRLSHRESIYFTNSRWSVIWLASTFRALIGGWIVHTLKTHLGDYQVPSPCEPWQVSVPEYFPNTQLGEDVIQLIVTLDGKFWQVEFMYSTRKWKEQIWTLVGKYAQHSHLTTWSSKDSS